MKKALLVQIILRSLTQSQSRPEDDRELSVDVDSLQQSEFELPVNNEAGNNPDSHRAFTGADKFLYVYAPFPIDLTVGGLIVPDFKKLFVITGKAGDFALTNKSTERAVVCSVFYA
jgi:hypothetical protein